MTDLLDRTTSFGAQVSQIAANLVPCHLAANED
jgi:hypothetical protein